VSDTILNDRAVDHHVMAEFIKQLKLAMSDTEMLKEMHQTVKYSRKNAGKIKIPKQ
jgi:hypothetical protein